ncbi:MAG: hypothetical protein MSK32_02825 [Paraprevotella sp.]|nr:hypothetical protein [Paraprevotella sp.]
MKTDLELRPIYHQSDEKSDAPLFFGLLAYWIVNTIRYKLKQHGITLYWTEIKRILSTQKAITTEADNALGEQVEIRLCSDPTDSAAELYRALGYTPSPSGVITFNPSILLPKKSVVPTRNFSKRNSLTCRIISAA